MDIKKALSSKKHPSPAEKLLIGTAAGTAGTLLMTLVMGAGRSLLPGWQQYPLPPRLITRAVASRAGLEEAVDSEPEATAATTIGHFGYGAAGGALYAAAAPYIPLPGLAKGLLFGVLFWLASYMGWIPLFGVLSPPTEHPRERSVLMIIAHLVYGGATGLAFEKLEERSR